MFLKVLQFYSSFGDDRMLVEKFVDNPRHIEIQVSSFFFLVLKVVENTQINLSKEKKTKFKIDPS